MAGPVVIAGVFLEGAAQRHRTGDEQQIGAGNDHEHRRKEPQQRLQRLTDGHGQPVGAAQQGKGQHRQQPSGPGRLFAHGLAVQQRHGADAVQLPQGMQEDQTVDGGEQHQRHQQRLDVHRERIADLAAEKVHQPQLRQLGQRHAQRKADGGGARVGQQRLPQQDAGDVALAHAQHVVQAELPAAAADEERMGVKQEDQGEKGDDHAAKAHDKGGAASAGHLGQQCGHRQAHENVEHGGDAGAGQQVRQVQPAVLLHARPRQTGVKSTVHCASPPACSMVSVSEII